MKKTMMNLTTRIKKKIKTNMRNALRRKQSTSTRKTMIEVKENIVTNI